VIAGVGCGRTESFRLLGCYAAWGGLKPTFRDYLPAPYSKGQDVQVKGGTDRYSQNVGFKPPYDPEDHRIQTPPSTPRPSKLSLNFMFHKFCSPLLSPHACYIPHHLPTIITFHQKNKTQISSLCSFLHSPVSTKHSLQDAVLICPWCSSPDAKHHISYSKHVKSLYSLQSEASLLLIPSS
jgi:hypothetical protein